MKKISFLVSFLLVTSVGAAQPKNRELKTATHVANIFLLGGQFRFEDRSDQTRALQSYSALNLSGNIFDSYYVGLEAAFFKESSGNNSLNVERKVNEYMVSGGYSVLNVKRFMDNGWEFVFHLIPTAYLGQNKISSETKILGATSKDNSEAEWSAGVGLLASMRLQYFVFELDTRALSSKSYEPQILSVSSARLGFSLPFH